MFIRINEEKFQEGEIVHFNLTNGPMAMPSRIIRIDNAGSNLAYAPFDVKEILICDELNPDDYYIKPESQSIIKKCIPRGLTIGEIGELNDAELNDIEEIYTYLRFTGRIIRISKADTSKVETRINKYSKELEVGVYYIDVVSGNGCELTVRLSTLGMKDIDIEKLQEGSCIKAVVSTSCIIIDNNKM